LLSFPSHSPPPSPPSPLPLLSPLPHSPSSSSSSLPHSLTPSLPHTSQALHYLVETSHHYEIFHSANTLDQAQKTIVAYITRARAYHNTEEHVRRRQTSFVRALTHISCSFPPPFFLICSVFAVSLTFCLLVWLFVFRFS